MESTKYPGLDVSEEAQYEQYLATQNNTPNPAAQPTAEAPWRNFQSMFNPSGRKGDYNLDVLNRMPQWLKDQISWKGADYFGSESSDYSGGYVMPGQTVKNAAGKTVVMLGPNKELNQNGYSLRDESKVTWDPDLGWVTTEDNLDDSGWQRRHKRAGKLALMAVTAPLAYQAITGGLASSGAAAGAISPVSLGLNIPNMVPWAGLPALGGAAAGAAGAAGGGLTLAQIAQGIRTAGSALGLARALTGGGSPGGGSRGSSGLAGGLGTVADIALGINNRNNNERNIENYREVLRTLIERGDPYGPERAAAIRRLRELESNPGSITSNPLFKSMNEKSQEDLARVFGARGMSVSGNEQGALQENFLANMNKFYGDEWSRTAREAGVFIDPGTSVQAGLTGAGNVLRASNNNNAATQDRIQRILGGDGSAGSGIWNILADWLDGDDDWERPDYFEDYSGEDLEYYDDADWGGT